VDVPRRQLVVHGQRVGKHLASAYALVKGCVMGCAVRVCKLVRRSTHTRTPGAGTRPRSSASMREPPRVRGRAPWRCCRPPACPALARRTGAVRQNSHQP
jgi:hypothetical protein